MQSIFVLTILVLAIYIGLVHISLIRFKTDVIKLIDLHADLHKKSFEQDLELMKLLSEHIMSDTKLQLKKTTTDENDATSMRD